MRKLISNNRRDFLKWTMAGLGTTRMGRRAMLASATELGGGGLLAPRAPHYAAKAKRLVILFFTGGFSHLDTFDYKPRLQKSHHQSAAHLLTNGKFLASPFRFSPAGENGTLVSDLFPRLRTMMDELCVIRSMHTDIVEHSEATLAMHTGSPQLAMPGIGAWLSYALGTYNQNLPSHIVLAKQNPYAGTRGWDNVFLPSQHQGVRIIPGEEPVSHLKSPAPSMKLHEIEQLMLRDINEKYARARPDDFELAARTSSFATANGMMRVAPPLFDASTETKSTLKMYGVEAGDNTSFGYQCLVARRMLEQGVRVIELVDTGSGPENWDAHGTIFNHRRNAKYVDQATAAMIQDMRQRGLLEDTLIAICTEFGRTPWQDNAKTPGRGHWARAFTCLLAGAGIQGGKVYGETDEFGLDVIADPCHVHDYHATILHLLGIDHTRLTYRYGGRDFRLTDVYGDVVHDILT